MQYAGRTRKQKYQAVNLEKWLFMLLERKQIEQKIFVLSFKDFKLYCIILATGLYCIQKIKWSKIKFKTLHKYHVIYCYAITLWKVSVSHSFFKIIFVWQLVLWFFFHYIRVWGVALYLLKSKVREIVYFTLFCIILYYRKQASQNQGSHHY